MKLPKSISKLFISIAVCQGAGLIGAAFTVTSIENWYDLLNQPSFKPPNSIFGPVWIILYTLMGISLYWILLKETKDRKVKDALKLFAAHLALNASWSIIFFGIRDIPLSLVSIIALWVLIIMVMVRFYKIDKRAALILLPYLAWVSFAAILNYDIFLLNN